MMFNNIFCYKISIHSFTINTFFHSEFISCVCLCSYMSYISNQRLFSTILFLFVKRFSSTFHYFMGMKKVNYANFIYSLFHLHHSEYIIHLVSFRAVKIVNLFRRVWVNRTKSKDRVGWEREGEIWENQQKSIEHKKIHLRYKNYQIVLFLI